MTGHYSLFTTSCNRPSEPPQACRSRVDPHFWSPKFVEVDVTGWKANWEGAIFEKSPPLKSTLDLICEKVSQIQKREVFKWSRQPSVGSCRTSTNNLNQVLSGFAEKCGLKSSVWFLKEIIVLNLPVDKISFVRHRTPWECRAITHSRALLISFTQQHHDVHGGCWCCRNNEEND